MNVLDFFGRTATYDAPLEVAAGIRATYFDAGHILGSASILLELEENGTRRRLVMSGDIGNAGRPLLNPPTKPPPCDAVVMETTYGDRLHKPLSRLRSRSSTRRSRRRSSVAAMSSSRPSRSSGRRNCSTLFTTRW